MASYLLHVPAFQCPLGPYFDGFRRIAVGPERCTSYPVIEDCCARANLLLSGYFRTFWYIYSVWAICPLRFVKKIVP